MINKEEKLFLQVKGNKNKQKRVTIPSDSKIESGDWVKVEGVEKEVIQNE